MIGRKGWTIKRASPGVYHLKYWTWEKAFLEVDLEKKFIQTVKDGVFGTPADKRHVTPLEISIITDKSMNLLGFSAGNCVVNFEVESKKIDVRVDGMSILSPDEWETAEVASNIYQLKHSSWIGFFWEIDAQHRKASLIYSDEFGKFGIPGSDLYKTVFAGGAAVPAKSTEPLPDAGFNSSAPHRVSEWTRNEKALFTSVLFQNTYDVLVVPFQVQGNAVDRANRSLMTRYLSNELKKQTGLALPDPAVLDRALGYGVRRLSNDEIYRAADDVKAKVVIRGYVGHDMDEKLFLTLLVQVRGSDGKLDHGTAVTRLDWKNIPFSDGQPPAEAFRGIVRDIIAKLPVQPVKHSMRVRFEKSNLPVPDSLASLTKEGSSALENAYYLQLLGMLYPEDSTTRYVDDFFEREPLFERSLVALEGISPDSADYRLLKARAWFYLRSRPAAIKALGMPKTPEEKAFMAFLNGNLPEMEKWAGKITSPIDGLITRIQLNDLRFDYSTGPYDREAVKEVILAHKGLELLLARRLTGKDIWDRMPNAIIKKLMDEAYPIKGFEIETVLRAKMVSGKDPEQDEDIDLAIYTHREKTLLKEPVRFASNGGSRPVPLDGLDLLYYLGEGTMWKKVRSSIHAQEDHEKAKNLLEKYEKVYTGHLKFMYLKEVTFRQLAQQQNNHLHHRVVQGLEDKACYHAQDQLAIARCDGKEYYRHDYPRHWTASDDAADRKRKKEYSIKGFDAYKSRIVIRLDHDLLYTHNAPILLVNYYDELISLGLHKEAEEFIKLNETRFEGHPHKISLMARVASKKGDYEKTAAVYEESITQNPMNWENYWSKGQFHFERGEYAKARAVFESYPEFNQKTGGAGFSYKAYLAGYDFLARGRIAEGKIFLKKSSNNDTGSQAEYLSRAHLATLDGDLTEAAANRLQSYRMYNDFDSIDAYIGILFVQGKNDEANAALNSIDLSDNLPFSALIGFRMDSVDEDEQMRRLTDEGFSRMYGYASFKYAVLGMMDRAPDAKELRRIENLGHVENIASKSARILGRAYHYLRKQDFQGAYLELKEYKQKDIGPLVRQNKEFVMPQYKEYRIILPYFSYAAAKMGNSAEAITLLNDVRSVFGEDYHYHLSMAFINGLGGRHAEALKSLEAVRGATTRLLSTPIPQWYKLVEACEWLYNESGRTEYREMAVSLAKTYQKIMPYWSWAYAVEAKYASPGPERTRALALTLYLDKKSERISGIPEKEKAAALKWLEKNNPFLSKKKPAGRL